MSVSFTCAAMACMSILRDLDALRTVAVVREVAGVFRGFAAGAAEEAFHEGWYERGEQGGDEETDGVDAEGDAADRGAGNEEGDPTNAAGASDEVADDASPTGDGDDGSDGADDDDPGPTAGAAAGRVRKQASDVLGAAVRIVDRREGRQWAVSVLSAWEGLGRFTRECCGVKPLTPLKAWRLLAVDPVAEVRRLYPKAQAGEAQAADWHASLGGARERHASQR